MHTCTRPQRTTNARTRVPQFIHQLMHERALPRSEVRGELEFRGRWLGAGEAKGEDLCMYVWGWMRAALLANGVWFAPSKQGGREMDDGRPADGFDGLD